MSHCDSHESEGGHPDEVCACCGTCIQCTGGKWSDHMDASCAQGIDTQAMTTLQRATARRMMWEERWVAANKPTGGPIDSAYLRACLREMDLVLKGIDKREAARKL